MNQKEFIDRLEGLLMDISAEERDEALQYYSGYFEDAGEENAEQVIQELGSPEKVAATIKTDLKGGGDAGEFTETGYSDSRFEQKANPATREPAYRRKEGYKFNRSSAEENTYEYNGSGEHSNSGQTDNGTNQRNSSAGRIVLLILIAIIALPVVFPILIGGAGLIIGLVCASFGLFAGLVIGAVALMIAGVALFVFAMTQLAVVLPVALLMGGTGLIIFVIGLLAAVGTVKLCMIVYPAMCRILINICRWPFHRREVS